MRGKVVKSDGWTNILTGLGIANKDKRLGTKVEWSPLRESDAEELYAQDDMAAKIVDMLPDDALREGIEYSGIEPDVEKALADEHKRLAIAGNELNAWKMARAYGGAGILVITDDPVDGWALPLSLPNIREIKGLQVLHRYELHPFKIDRDITSQNYGMPEIYQLQPRNYIGNSSLAMVHHSRIIRFDGAKLPSRLFIRNHYWHDSVLTRVYNALANFNTSYDGAAVAMQDWRLAVFKIRNLADLVANGKDDAVIQRLNLVNLSKSIARAIVVDAEAESFEISNTQFTGVKDMLVEMKERLQAASSIPNTRLFGNSPTGLGGSGRHEEVNWYDAVAAEQQNYLLPRHSRLLSMLFAQKKNTALYKAGNGLVPEKLQTVFPPLWQLDETEQAAVREKQANIDKTYLEYSVLDPNEVRQSRFGGPKYSTETKVEGDAPPPPEPPKPVAK